MDFPIQDLMVENACSQYLLDVLHPEGLRCPRCRAQEGFQVHRYYREPVLDYRCPACGRVFHAWSGTGFEGTHYRPSVLVLIVRGFARGEPTALREAYDRQWVPDLSTGTVLTDDYNPLEYFDAAKRERYRRMLAISMGGT